MRQNPIRTMRFHLTLRLGAGVLGLAAAAGTVHGDEIFKSVDANGNVVYSDHLDPSLSQSKLVQLDPAQSLPGQLHFCWTNCFTLLLDNGVYRRADGTPETWTVETFSSTAVVLHRHDAPAAWNGNSEDVVYAGQVDNGQLVNVTVNGRPTNGISAAWGAALSALPGDNAERDGKASADAGAVSSVSSATAPPPLPQEDQPALPDDGYLWTPGYWYWRNQAYIWVPGVWVRPPQLGVLWTPGYWSMAGAVFVFHPGHWGLTVGYYGGVNYGYGYFGTGYSGGHWIGNSFAYNTAVNRMNAAVVNHSYAEPTAMSRASRGVQSYNAPVHNAASTHAALPHRPAPAVKSAASIDRTGDTAPATKIEKPAAVAAPKTPRVTANRAPPVK
jgi:hypothetical protein